VGNFLKERSFAHRGHWGSRHMRSVFAEMVVDGVEIVGGRKRPTDAPPDWSIRSIGLLFRAPLQNLRALPAQGLCARPRDRAHPVAQAQGSILTGCGIGAGLAGDL
jgi:hypothetical protein